MIAYNVLEKDTYTNGTITISKIQRYKFVEFDEDGEPCEYGNVVEDDLISNDDQLIEQITEDDEFIWPETLEDEMGFESVSYEMLELEVSNDTWKTTGKVLYTTEI
jgi:hypothetical protein